MGCNIAEGIDYNWYKRASPMRAQLKVRSRAKTMLQPTPSTMAICILRSRRSHCQRCDPRKLVMARDDRKLTSSRRAGCGRRRTGGTGRRSRCRRPAEGWCRFPTTLRNATSSAFTSGPDTPPSLLSDSQVSAAASFCPVRPSIHWSSSARACSSSSAKP